LKRNGADQPCQSYDRSIVLTDASLRGTFAKKLTRKKKLLSSPLLFFFTYLIEKFTCFGKTFLASDR
jgi:hypothetical protein